LNHIRLSQEKNYNINFTSQKEAWWTRQTYNCGPILADVTGI